MPSYQWVLDGGWNIADCVARSYDLEGMQVGTVAAGRIGLAVLRRLKPFDVGLHYTDRHRLPETSRRSSGLTFHETAERMVGLRRRHDQRAAAPGDRGSLRRRADRRKMKRGAYLSTRRAARSATATPSCVRSKAGSSPATRVTSGSPSPRPGPPLAHDAPPRDDPAHLRLPPLRAGPLRGRNARDPRVLPRGPAASARST